MLTIHPFDSAPKQGPFLVVYQPSIGPLRVRQAQYKAGFLRGPNFNIDASLCKGWVSLADVAALIIQPIQP